MDGKPWTDTWKEEKMDLSVDRYNISAHVKNPSSALTAASGPRDWEVKNLVPCAREAPTWSRVI